ncbi:transferase [Panicum miliaceum]|uniref:Transferase n=1 Tax=Panicum miliaceum TaxID=4540 RepID=A0A3L6PWH7_PANMI|nr:transferase [Panicum miliaceum]
MAPVRIVDVGHVPAPAPAAGAAPPEPTIKLNAMEAQWVVAPVLQHLLLFEGDRLPPFDDVLRHLADTGEVAIRRSADDEGVRFVVAETDADARSLACDEDHDVRSFEGLVPEVDMYRLPAPLVSRRVRGAKIEKLVQVVWAGPCVP